MDDKTVKTIKAYQMITEYSLSLSNDDRQDVIAVAMDVKAGKLDDARKKMRSLDTYIRECFPKEAWQFVSLNTSAGRRSFTAVLKLKGADKVYHEDWAPGVVAKVQMDFPGDASDHQVSQGLVREESDLINSLVEVEYEDGKLEEA